MARFDGKVAIITGSASGIGKDIALHFAAKGGIPVIADLNLGAADVTAKEGSIIEEPYSSIARPSACSCFGLWSYSHVLAFARRLVPSC